MTDSFLSELDRPELEKPGEDAGPVDALNLVSFLDAVRYRWYGLLLFPVILLRGGRPLFVGEYVRSLVGEKIFDELGIIRYPNLRTFVRIVTGRLYSLLNRHKAKGVHYFEFSFTSPFRESSDLRKKGHRLVILFNYQEGTFGNVLDKITNILGKYPVIQLYASRKIDVIPFQGMTVFSDPNPCQYEGIVIFSILEDDPERLILENNTVDDLKSVTVDLAVDIYRSIGISESMPWVNH